MSFKSYAQKALPKPFISGKPAQKFSGEFQPGDRIFYFYNHPIDGVQKSYGTFVEYFTENRNPHKKLRAKWDNTYREYGLGWMYADRCFRATGE